MPKDHKDRSYLASIEAAKFLDITVKELHRLTRSGKVKAKVAASGQKRYDIKELKRYQAKHGIRSKGPDIAVHRLNEIRTNGTVQRLIHGNSMNMEELEDASVHLMVTSPPYFNAKMYTSGPIEHDLGNIHDLEEWFDQISKVWAEVYRVLQPGRKAFINIMNLPIRVNKTFRTLNLVGRTIDVMEDLGFIFKRDIVWHKTHGVKAHFGTYPYPGGILINNMHEFILEFNKPDRPGLKKYDHLTKEQKENSRLDKEFWLKLKNTDVWLISPENSSDNRSHVAPFPYELPHRLIKAYSYISETVLDPFAGSFITLKAASDLGRNGIGYEINDEILHDAMRNITEFQSKLF